MEDDFLKMMKRYTDDESYAKACWVALKHKYSAGSRHYHNLEHLAYMFRWLATVKSEVKNLDAMLFAIYYHDSIYNTTRSDNEHQSALYFKKMISKTSFEAITEVMDLIEATKEHMQSDDTDTNILLDLDLAVLGEKPENYLIYAKAIRKEYYIYPDFMDRKGRKKVLMNMLNLEAIYKTDFFKTLLETTAIENLKAELKNL
ncbi:hypothetical protein H0I25_01950 [Cellulophaga sp. HaHa_2_95]|uniref:HD domain-containing protein n=1 Tax=Cellulophaga sp. HaHa_2_95 TaxID=2745558 RepID=UPI001C4F4676|nr:hypothetical protein [Cellulophaga sp. HaHa_2_95]QXP56580.1 hypothetical protein H0I25_01950 [Cellulophaga sp. HaHa_2_95]